MESKPLTPEKITNEEDIKEMLKDINMNMDGSSLIQKNEIVFEYKDKTYRCVMPNQRQQSEAEQAQNKCKIKLLQEEDTLTRKQLIKVLKDKQEIDIAVLEKAKGKLQEDLQTVYLELAVVPTDNPIKIQEIKQKKSEIESKFMDITIEIVELLSPCIEEQAKIQYFKYLGYLCTEEHIKDTEDFKRIWQTYEEFENNNTGLSFKSVESIQTLLLSV